MPLFDLHWQDNTDIGLGIDPYVIQSFSTEAQAVASLERDGIVRRDPGGLVFDVPADDWRNVATATVVRRDVPSAFSGLRFPRGA